MIITIDGPAGAGKGTVAKELANKLRFIHIDTGLYYRALAFQAMQLHYDAQHPELLYGLMDDLCMKNMTITLLKTEDVANMASKIAVYPTIREGITKKIRKDVADALKKSSVIVDGRDVGTVIFPSALCKLFITASPKERAKRRAMELGGDEEVRFHDLTKRDERDQSRKIAPLTPAHDALVIDTTNLTIDEACRNASSYVKEFLSRNG